MKTLWKNPRRILLYAFSLLCLVGISACACRRATPEAPFVINFEFLNPIPATPAEGKRFIVALEKYAIRSATKIKVGKIVVWPPPIPPIGKMKTERTVKSEEASNVMPTGHPNKTDSNPQMTGGSGIDMNRPVKTDYISFADGDDLRDFINCIAGKGCPDRK